MFEMRWLTYYTVEKRGQTAPNGQPLIGGMVEEVAVPHTKLQYRYKTILGNWSKWKDIPEEVVPCKEQPRGLLVGDEDPIKQAAKQVTETLEIEQEGEQ